MRVKMLTEICGKPAFHRGEVVDLERRIAQVWIKEGLAAPAGPPDESTPAQK